MNLSLLVSYFLLFSFHQVLLPAIAYEFSFWKILSDFTKSIELFYNACLTINTNRVAHFVLQKSFELSFFFFELYVFFSFLSETEKIEVEHLLYFVLLWDFASGSFGILVYHYLGNWHKQRDRLEFSVCNIYCSLSDTNMYSEVIHKTGELN